jgi:hypothetical protein
MQTNKYRQEHILDAHKKHSVTPQKNGNRILLHLFMDMLRLLWPSANQAENSGQGIGSADTPALWRL